METGLKIHHDVIEIIIKRMEQLEKYRNVNLLTYDPKEKVADSKQQIKLNEFFRNDLIVLILGLTTALIAYIFEITYLHLKHTNLNPLKCDWFI